MKCNNNLIVERWSKLTILLVVFIVTCGSGGSVIQYDKDDPSLNYNNFVEETPLTRVIDGGVGSNYGENIIASKRNFSGSADMTIQYYKYDPFSGQDVFVEEKQYHYSVYIFTKAPLKIGSISESNPFNISIYPNRDSSNVKEGYIDIRSAALCSVNTFRDLLLQYWNLTLNGEKLSGTLADTHSAEASAANLLWAWEDIAGLKTILPFPIAVNTTIQGIISDTGLKLSIQGETTDTYRKFVVKIVGQRNRPNNK
ncbi:MAG: hypothetical protein U9N63_00950 [Pseudomonadota bacterium]|nr:hypothetical protein [Pseudomonadota bacterium]